MAYDDSFNLSSGLPQVDWLKSDTPLTEQGNDEPGFLGDLGRATVAGAYGVASALGGAGEYLQGGAEEGSLSTQLREFGNEGAEAWSGSMSKRGQRELRAGVIEGDTIWDQGVSGAVRSLALKTGSSIPSLVASVLPGGLVARALGATAGTVAGGSVAAGISGGGVFEEIQSGILKSPDAQLQSQSELYAELRARGMSENEAKRELVDFAAGSKPLIMAAITAGTSAFGLEGFVAGLTAGGGSRGIARSALRGATGEAAQEFIESGTESILTQQGKVDTNRASGINWLEVLDKALEGAAVGGVLGGAVGGVLGRGEREQTPPPADPTQPGAKPGETPPPADIAVNPELEEDVDIEEEAPVATSLAVDPDQQAAIAAATQTAAPAAPAELDTNALIEEVRGELASVRAGIETLGPEGVSSAEQAALQPDTITPQIDEVKTQLRQVRDQIPPAAANEVQPPVVPAQPTLAAPEAGKSLELSQTPQAPVARLTPEAAPVEPASPPPEPQAPAPVKQPTLRRGAAIQNKVGGEADADAVEGYGAPAWMKYVARTAKAMGEAAPQAVRDANDRLAEREKLPKRDPRKKRYDAELEQLRQQYVAELRQRDKARRESFERADAGGDSDTEIKARDVISRFAPAAAETNKKIGEGARRKAVQARFEQIVKAAAEAGIKIPTKGTPNEAPHIGALRYYNRMAKAIAAGRLSALNHSNTVDEILGTDALVRGGNPEAAAELISVEDGRAAARAGADENTLSDEQAREVEVQRTQRDAARAGEDEANVTDEVNPNAVEEVAADENPQDEAEAEEYLVEVGLAQPVARVAPAPDEDDGPAYRAFQAPKRVAAVEVSRKRSIKPKAEAAKEVSRAKVTPQVKPTIAKPAAPTEAQKEAGNYRKQHLDVQGLPVTIETAKGQERSGTAPDGTRWAVKMPADYGYVKRTRGADGDQIDVYLGSDPSSDVVVLIDQKDAGTGKFDEHKAMLGFKTVADAVEAYSKGFSDGRAQERVQDVTVMTMAEFKEWLRVPQTKPASTQGVGDSALPVAGWGVVEASPVTADVIPQYATATQTIAGYADASLSLADLDPRRQLTLRLLGSTLKRLAGSVPIRVVTYEEMSRDPAAVQAMESGRVSSVPGGYYAPATGEIVLLDTRLQTQTAAFDIFIHEALHAATNRAIYTNPKHKAQIRALMDALDADLRKLSEFTGEPYQRPYGLTNEDEFISEAFSNRAFQERLMRAQAPAEVLAQLRGDQPKGFTLWRGFIAMVKRMLGFNVVPDSLFEGAVLVTEQLLGTRTAGPWRANTSALPMFSAPTGNARTEATGGWFKQFGYRFAHLEYLGQRAAGLFTFEGKDQLRRLIDAVQRIQPKSRAIAEEGHKLAAEEIELAKRDPAMAEAKAQLGIDVTTLNVNLIDRAGVTEAELLAANTHLGKNAINGEQAKGNLVQLQRRFEALSPEARALWARQTKYYRDTQNRIIEAELRTLMSSLGGKLTPAQVDDFVKRTMAGTLTDADSKVLGKTIFDGLSRLPAFRKIEGTYFPLMRHGTQVVQTLLRMGDLMGGKQLDKSTVEFRAATDKEARKLAKAFARGTTVPATRITKTYYLRSTGEQLSALNATGQDVDVAYRVRLNRDGVFFFDDRTQAERFRRQSAGEYEQVSETMPVADYNHNMELTNTQMASLMRSVNARDDVNDAQKALIQVTLRQAAARMASGNRIAKRTIKRQGNVGASTDMGRSLIRYGEAAGGYLAKSEYMPEVQDALRLMRRVAAENTYSPRRGDMSMILNDVEARIKGNVEQYAEPNAFVQTMLQLSFLDKLFSPAYSIINAMQPVMVTLPWLSGRYGATRAAAYLTSAYRSIGMGDVLGGGIGNTFVATKSFNRAALDTSDLLGSIKKRLATQSDGKQLIGVLEMLQERGALDDGAVFELSSNVASGQGPTRTFLARVDRVARQLPAAVEQMNRAVAAIAAYRLAYSQGKDANAASKAAYEAVMMTQFDYSNANSSTFFTSQNGFARFALQFRKYAANMSVLLYDMARQALKGATPEERRIARKQLTALAAVQVTMAGALSLPGLELVKLLAMAVAAATGGGGYDDIERYLRRTLEQSMGQTGMEAVLKGLPRAAGIDISTRVSLADMWTFGEPREYKRENLQAYVLGMVLGAPGGLAFDWIEAMQHAGRGEMGKAIEKAFPVKFIADTVKGAKAMDDGYVGPAGAAAQALGFRPSALSRRAEEVGDRIAARKDMEREKKDLEREYQNASTAGERAKVMSKIRQFNQRDDVGRNRISTQWMDKAREERRVRRGDPVEATR